MQRVQNMQIDGTNLLDGIMGGSRDEIDYGTVSAGTGKKVQETEKLSKGRETTDVIYHRPQQEKQAGTMEDVAQQAENMNAELMKNQMVVASNTTTTTDCRQIEEEGFSLRQTDMDTIVTVTDKIKMELAKAGVDISSFGDGLSAEQLEAVYGNTGLAQELAGRIQQLAADIPLTAENLDDCEKALQEADELHELNDGALKYMLDNQLEPTIANLYTAQYSGSAVYKNQKNEPIDFSGMEEQITKIIAQSGQQNYEQASADSRWLIQNQIPLTADSLNYLSQLKDMQLPNDRQFVLDKIITALSEGKRPQEAVLIDEYSLFGQAQKTAEVIERTSDADLAYVVSQGEKITVENLEKAHNVIAAGEISPQEAEMVEHLVKDTLQENQITGREEISAPHPEVLSKSAAAGMELISSGVESVPAGTESVSAGTESAAAGQAPAGTQEAGNKNSEVQADSKADDAIQAVPETGGQNADAGSFQNGSGRYSQTQVFQYTEIQIVYITARRHLEEVRLKMTVEASYSMLKHGISVNTSSMEDLIDHLKEIENHFYKNLLSQDGVEAADDKVSLFAETTDKIQQLKGMPAYAIGVRNLTVTTLEELHQEGSAMQRSFQQADERYETMQTQVRSDLGDSIKKAFRNIGDILEDMGQEKSPANERAARILGYNRIEITPENLTRMKAADQQVQMAFHNLTPSVVREFINRGINPLDLEINELNQQAEQIKTELNIDTQEEKYSEYLYKLEQNQSISKEERSSYIGIYRLMNHVVQSDGAAVGALVNQGAQITMRNLLTAVRSEHRGNMDVTVDESFGELESGGYVDSITDQIEAGYQQQCMKQAFDEISPERLRVVSDQSGWEDMTPEQFLQQLQEAPEDLSAEEAYYQQQLEDLSKCAKTAKEVYQVLEQYDLPNTVMNVMAVSELMYNRNQAYRRFFQSDNGRRPDASDSLDEYMTKREDGSVDVDFDAVKAELLKRFGEDIKKPKELAKAMNELAECAEKCMSTMIMEPDVTSLDIRSLRLMNAQISVSAKMTSAECFSMPIVVDGEVTNVTLKIVRDKEEKGLVNITLETSRMGKIAAELKAKKEGITGYVASDSKKTRDLLQSAEEEISQAFKEVLDGPLDIHYITSSKLDLNHFASQSGSSEEPESEEVREVQTRTLYGIAEGFIRVLKTLDAS